MPPTQVQQRLFTGGIFSEEVNDQLLDFARRHHLTSAVWAPIRCFDSVLRTYGVSVRPGASLLAVSVERDSHVQGSNTLVNAEQTSHRFFLEHFSQYVMPSGEKIRNRSFSRHSGTLVSTSSVSRFPSSQFYQTIPISAIHRCFHPLTTSGEPLIHLPTVELLSRIQKQHGFQSNYWTRTPPTSLPKGSVRRLQGWFHVEEHPRSGRFNPVWCVDYTPHTLTNHPFPVLFCRLMLDRAVRYRYVSRLWLTQEEAQRAFGVGLRPCCKDHNPPLWCHHFTGGLQQQQYYCADQFDIPPGAVPRAREINLAASGVDIGSPKLRAFPLLAMDSTVERECSKDSSNSLSSTVISKSTVGYGTLQPDSAARQERLAQIRNAFRTVRLFDMYERNKLTSEMETLLSRERFLRGWRSPYFLRTTSILRYGLRVRSDGQQGLLLDVSEKLLCYPRIGVQQECWMNASQLTEPAVVHQLTVHHPVSVIWGYRLRGIIATNCATLQIIRGLKEHRWILSQAVQVISHWKLRPGAIGVPFFNYEDASPAAQTNHSYPLIWYNLSDVVGITSLEYQLLLNYHPVYDTSLPVRVIALKVFMTLRALQSHFESPVWIQLPEEQKEKYVTHKQRGKKAPRRGPTNVFESILPENSTLVFYQGNVYMNQEEYDRAYSLPCEGEADAEASSRT